MPLGTTEKPRERSHRRSRHGSARVAKLALISAVMPIFGQQADHAEGVPRSVFDGTNRPGAKVSLGVFKQTLFLALQASLKSTIDCVTAFSETDFRADMAAIDVPTLVVQGDDDQVVSFAITGKAAAPMIEGAQLKVYAGAPHAVAQTHAQQRNEDLLAFLDAELPLAEVASACGFADQSHFTRVFAQAVGMPPGAWRRHKLAD